MRGVRGTVRWLVLATAAASTGATGAGLLRAGWRGLAVVAADPEVHGTVTALEGAVVSVVAAAAGGLLLWLALGTALIALDLLLGATGAAVPGLAAALRRVTPAALRRAVVAAVGAGLACGAAVPAQADSAPVDPGWPAFVAAAERQMPVVQVPPPDRVPQARPPVREVVVGPGDTLWAIAARDLPVGSGDAAVAAHWPRWYAANRTVVGDDPDHIETGMRLVAPGSLS